MATTGSGIIGAPNSRLVSGAALVANSNMLQVADFTNSTVNVRLGEKIFTKLMLPAVADITAYLGKTGNGISGNLIVAVVGIKDSKDAVLVECVDGSLLNGVANLQLSGTVGEIYFAGGSYNFSGFQAVGG